MHGFQIWVNLPARDKLTAPRYQEIPRAAIPEAATPDGCAVVHVIAGEALGAKAVIEMGTPIGYLRWIFYRVRRSMCRFRRTAPPMFTSSRVQFELPAAR